MIDLIAIAAVDRETEMTYVRRERDWAAAGPRRRARHRAADAARPPGVHRAAGNGKGGGNGHGGGRAAPHTHGTD